ncbi:hypothetical protein [Variovorax sp. PAMC26660]|uniref:hypothetical protein n=1 Tax=Variovorax sp. PAMC26660 TaxID=2762322 RepID=UPI00164E1EEA|nr:hypothetical protein [Variovorax sp. PAMC26660]QNK65776.1 hypothetical protein H7F35_21475 [Variovorax sp. PAMC26660]
MTKIFDIVPGWLWAIFLALALVAAFGEREVGQHYKADAIVQKANVTALSSAIKTQKDEAAATLRTISASVLAQQKTIDAAHAAQEQKDATNVQVVAGLQSGLRDALATRGSRLCNPAAAGRGGSRGGAAGQAAVSASAGAADAAQASGVLSADAQGLLGRLMKEADDINNAYASSKADGQTVRGQGAPADYSLGGGKLPTK